MTVKPPGMLCNRRCTGPADNKKATTVIRHFEKTVLVIIFTFTNNPCQLIIIARFGNTSYHLQLNITDRMCDVSTQL